MSFPRAKMSVAPQLVSRSESICRSHRRRLARRQMTSTESTALSVSNFKTNQIAGSSDSQSAVRLKEPLEQAYGREMFLQTIVEACASNVAVLDELGNILYVSKPWRLSAEKYGAQGGSHPLNLNCLEKRNGKSVGPSHQSSALAEDIQAILDGKVREFHNEYCCPSLSGASWFVVHAARLDLPGTAGAFRVLVNSSDITHARKLKKPCAIWAAG